MALELFWLCDIYDGIKTVLTMIFMMSLERFWLIFTMALELFWLYDIYDGLRTGLNVWYLRWPYICFWLILTMALELF
jgi:hypothetical protein